jgi:hypothetical protein
MDVLMFLLQGGEKSLEFFGAMAAGIAFIGYLLILVVKSFPKMLDMLMTKIFSVDKQNHIEATAYRKKVLPKIRTILSDLAEDIGADRALLLEYSNGTSNLVGLPFLYITATVEVLRQGMHSAAEHYQKTNVSVISHFIERVEAETFLYICDIEEIKEEFPVMYSLMEPNHDKSVLFYALYSEDSTIGFIVVSSIKNELNKKSVLPRTATAAQAISSLLNYDKIKAELK